ncbi:hypothetical protein CRYUN_Cryun34aG0022500 [Craigia yunnanensis]
MKGVVVTSPGDPEVLQLQEVEDPKIKDDEVLIKVEDAALNRGDIYQRQGFYPPPQGASPYPGLECSGVIESVGENASRWKVGDKVNPSVFYYKRRRVCPESGCSSRASSSCSIRCYIVECCLSLRGVDPWGLQWKWYICHSDCKVQRSKSFVIAGNEQKLVFCKDLGADICINYKSEDFVARVKEKSGGKGVDVILDSVGAAYLQQNLDSLNIDGRIFIIGSLSGFIAEVNIGAMFAKQLQPKVLLCSQKPPDPLLSAALRTRSVEEKAAVVSEVEKNVWPASQWFTNTSH